MTLRQWYLGIAAVAAAALIPLSANADSVMNLGAAGAKAGDTLKLGLYGVTVGNGNDFPIGTADNPATGGSCTLGVCNETTFGVGILSNVIDPSKSAIPIWNAGAVSASNPGGLALAYVIYGIADSSVRETAPGSGIYNVDNTGANSTTQTSVTYTRPADGSTALVNVNGGDSKIHIDIYSMTAAQAPCFEAGCANEVSVTDRTGRSTVTGITDVGTLWASFTLQSGATPLNLIDDPLGSGTVTLTQTFNFANRTGVGRGYGSCTPTDPGCTDFGTSTEAHLDAVSGYLGDPAFAANLANALFTYNIAAASQVVIPGTYIATIGTHIIGAACNDPTDPNCTATVDATQQEHGAGWTLHITDPAYTTAAIPEPASLALLGSALAFFGVAVRRRRKGMSA